MKRNKQKRWKIKNSLDLAGHQSTNPNKAYIQPGCNRMEQGYHPQQETSEKQSLKKIVRRKRLYRIALFALVSIFLFAAYQIVSYLIHSHKAKQEEEIIRTIIAESSDNESNLEVTSDNVQDTIVPKATAASAEETNGTHPESTSPAIIPGFSTALSINPDTVGKLKLGESIDTYVVQRDNSYYLRRSFAGEYSFSGAIFLDATCSIYPRSRMLIIHGHNMRDGTAFGKLSRFDSINYLNQYPVIHFSTLYESGKYQPFAVVYYSINPKDSNYLNIYKGNYLSDEAVISFFQNVQSMSVYRIPIIVKPAEDIIVLTTCATDDPDMRFAVFAVKHSIL